MSQQTALKLEKHLIPWSIWQQRQDVPNECREIALRESESGISTGVGFTKERGYYVLVTAGQGPIIAYQER